MGAQFFTPEQSALIKENFETFYGGDAGPEMFKDPEHVLDEILRDLPKEDRERFWDSSESARFTEQKINEQLKTYEHYAEYLKENLGIQVDDRTPPESEFSENHEEIFKHDEPSNTDASSSDSKEGTSGEGTKDKDAEEPKVKVSHEMRDEIEERKRGDQPRTDEIDPATNLSPQDRKALMMGRNMQKASGSLNSLTQLPAFLFDVTTKRLGGIAGSLFTSASAGYAESKFNRQVRSADKTGIIPSADIGKNVLDKRMKKIEAMEKDVSDLHSRLKEAPSDIALRSELRSKVISLSTNISQTSKIAASTDKHEPGIKDKFAGKLQDSGKKLDDFMKEQKIFDLKIFKELQESMKKMMETLTNIFKRDKKGPEPSAS